MKYTKQNINKNPNDACMCAKSLLSHCKVTQMSNSTQNEESQLRKYHNLSNI